MKKFLAILFLAYSNIYAGFFSSMVGGAIGASAASGGHSVRTYQAATIKTRFDKVNTYLWKMHKSGNYSKDYAFYLKYLEQSEDIGDLDTVAWVYKDHGDKKKAIEIYKTRIIPWIKIEDKKTQNKYETFFLKIQDKWVKPETKKRVHKKTDKQRCIAKGGRWIWIPGYNKWVCQQ